MHAHGSIHLVLVANGTPVADAAAHAVRELADPATVDRITVVAVGQPLDFGTWSFGVLGLVGMVPQTLVDDMAAKARSWAESECARVARQLTGCARRVEHAARLGRAVDEIVAVARQGDADVIVIGAGGVNGTVTEVMRCAPCPVLVVRPSADEPPVRGRRADRPAFSFPLRPHAPHALGAGA